MKTEIAIIGGGMVGISQAVALAHKGFDVVVIDREDPKTILSQNFDGRVSAVAWKSVELLKRTGVWEFIEPHSQAINDIRVSDNNSLLFTHFDSEEIGDKFGYIVENRHIRAGLYKRAKQLKNLNMLAPCEVKEINFAERIIEINKGQIEYQLLIAADGKFSKTRAAAGIKTTERNYQQTGIVCTIEHELPHHGLAHEKFLPAGPFAVLPMKSNSQGNRSSLVWTEPTEIAHIYMKMSDAEFLAEIEKRCDYLGKVKLVNVGAKNRWSYPLSMSHANSYIAENFALIGDAAHSIHPIAGQGVNLGFRDVVELTRLLVEKRQLGLQLSSALAEYEKLRKLDNGFMIFATDALNRLFSNNIIPLRIARDLGLGVVNQIPQLKKLFMKYASGKF